MKDRAPGRRARPELDREFRRGRTPPKLVVRRQRPRGAGQPARRRLPKRERGLAARLGDEEYVHERAVAGRRKVELDVIVRLGAQRTDALTGEEVLPAVDPEMFDVERYQSSRKRIAGSRGRPFPAIVGGVPGKGRRSFAVCRAKIAPLQAEPREPKPGPGPPFSNPVHPAFDATTPAATTGRVLGRRKNKRGFRLRLRFHRFASLRRKICVDIARDDMTWAVHAKVIVYAFVNDDEIGDNVRPYDGKILECGAQIKHELSVGGFSDECEDGFFVVFETFETSSPKGKEIDSGTCGGWSVRTLSSALREVGVKEEDLEDIDFETEVVDLYLTVEGARIRG